MRIAYLKSESRTVQVEGIGPVILRRNRRARRLNLRISPGKPVTITLPYFVSEKAALFFLNANREWALEKIQAIKNYQPPVITPDEKIPIHTRNHRLELKPVDSDEIEVMVRPGIVRVCYPDRESVRSPRVQEGIAQGLIAAYRIEAKQYLPRRVQELAKLYGFHYKRVFIKNLKSRWGSCSEHDNINLNLNLMRLSDELIDYVILHELTHTRVKNHSPLFWKELERICPKAKVLRKQLKFTAVRRFLQ